MTGSAPRHHFALTPTGAGVLSLCFPGLVIAVVLRQPLLMSVSIGAGLALVVNAITARRLVGQLSARITGPATATAGELVPVTLEIEADHPIECFVSVQHGVRPWIPAIAPSTGDTVISVEQRGVLDRLGIRLQTAAPLGLIACVRSSSAPLGRLLHVGPRRVDVSIDSFAGGSQDRSSARSTGDELVGVRPYAVGDSPRDVHWPSVARTGSMIVRDRRSGLGGAEVEVVVDCSGSASGADDVPGRARSVLEQLLAQGWEVSLSVAGSTRPDGEPSPRPHTSRVASTDDIIRRLAGAGRGPVGDLGPGPTRRIVIDAEGHRWHTPS